MAASAASVMALLERELKVLVEPRVTDHIRGLLIAPQCQMREWDYGEPGESFPCWLVLEHKASNTGIAYCEHGYGPAMPWGLLFLSGTQHMSMGMDDRWYEHFLEAYFQSRASSELPIWRVFRHNGIDFPGEPITGEDSWENTWAAVNRLRGEKSGFRYDCWQGIYSHDA